MRSRVLSVFSFFVFLALPMRTVVPPSIGQFENATDIGAMLYPGKASFDTATNTYTIAASGENMWFAKDEFQFLWNKQSGDVSLSAEITFLENAGNPHRKAVLMIRQSLDPDSPYADIALHGNGMTSLQYRDEKGAITHELQSGSSSPARLRIEKRGDYFSMWLGNASGDPQFSGGSIRVQLKGAFYVGIGFCSHDKNAVASAAFSNVRVQSLNEPPASAKAQPILYSTLETVSISSTDRHVVYSTPGRIEAPNWTRDGKTLVFNRKGRIETIPAEGGSPVPLDTGFAIQCNNDHGLSPDGKELAISDQSQDDHKSTVYIVPFAGGAPRRITKKSPSYWHGWSPDGKKLAFVGERNGEFDIYTIPAAGGDETRLTTAAGLDDGPEYSPDGKYIYLNSERTGHMQIWRMNADGSDQTQVTRGELNDWFPHLSPDGAQMVILSYPPDVKGHPENKDVTLRLLSLKDGKITVLAKLFGGQGTINVPSWSPDGTKLAFVSYTLVQKP